MQSAVDVDVRGWVDQGTCAAYEVDVVAFAGEVHGDLFHVGSPVDFGVFKEELV